tara:strand:- start:10235 stop:10486 length:252 start_codon:yes stop_codon:yes gene_type:complete
MSARKPTQQQLIMAVLERHGDWVWGYDLAQVQVVWGGEPYWLSHNAGVRARELARDGAIMRREVDGVVQYLAKADPRQQRLAI